MKGTAFIDIPLEPSGSPTYPLDIVATKDSKSGKVMVTVANPTEETQSFALTFDGGKPGTSVKVYALAPDKMEDLITVDEPNKIQVQTRTEKFNKNITVAPNSVTMYEFTFK